MTVVADLQARLSADVSAFESSMQGALGMPGKFGTGTGVAIAAVTAATIGATKSAIDYQSQMMNVGNNANLTSGQIKQMSSDVLNLAANTGASTDRLSAGFMHAYDMSGQYQTSMAELTVANEAAIASGDNVANTTNILSNVMHEYGDDRLPKGISATQQFAMVQQKAAVDMGVMHLAAAESNMTLQQFSDAAGPAIAMAANFRVPLTQASAAMAAMSKHGLDASMSATQLRAIIQHISAPSKGAEKALSALSQQTGVDLVKDFSAGGLASKGLTGVMGDLHTAMSNAGLSTAQQAGEIEKLIPATRGGLGMMILMGTGAKDYTNILSDLNDKQKTSTITEAQYQRTMHTVGQEFAVAKAKVEVFAIELGEHLLPYVSRFLDFLTHLKMSDFAGAIGIAKDAIHGLASIIPGTISIIKTGFHDAQTAVHDFMMGLSGNVTSTTGMSTFGKIFVDLGQTLHKVIPDIKKLIDGLVKDVESFFKGVSGKQVDTSKLSNMQKLFHQIGQVVHDAVPKIIDFVKHLVKIGHEAEPEIKKLWDVFNGKILPVITKVAKFVDGNLKPTLIGAASIILAIVVPAFVAWSLAVMSAAVETAIAAAPLLLIAGLAIGAYEAFKHWKEIKSIIEKNVIDPVKHIASTVGGDLDTAKGKVESFANTVKNDLKSAFDAVKTPIEVAATVLTAVFLPALVTAAAGAVTSAATTVGAWIGEAAAAVTDAALDAAAWLTTIGPAAVVLATTVGDLIAEGAAWVTESATAVANAVLDAGAWLTTIGPAYAVMATTIGDLLAEGAEWVAESAVAIANAALDAGAWLTTIAPAAAVMATTIGDLISMAAQWVIESAAAVANAAVTATAWAMSIAGAVADAAIAAGALLEMVADWAIEAAAALAAGAATAAAWVMALGPIGLLIAAIVAVVAAVGIAAYFIVTHWSQVKTAVITAVEAIWHGMEDAWNAIKRITQTIWDWIKQHITLVIDALLLLVTGPIGLIVALIIENWSTIKQKTLEAWDAVKRAVGAAWDWIKAKATDFWNWLKQTVSSGYDWVKSKISGAWSDIKQLASSAWDYVKGKATAFYDWIKQTIGDAYDWIKSKIEDAWTTIKQDVSAAWDWIKGKAQTFWDNEKTGWTNLYDAIKQKIEDAWNTIKSDLSAAWDWIKAKAQTFWDNEKQGWINLYDAVKSKVESALSTIKSDISSAWDTIKSTVSNAATTVKTDVENAWTALQTFIITKEDAIKSDVQQAWTDIKQFFSDGASAIKQTWSQAWSDLVATILSMGGQAKSDVQGIVSDIKGFFSGAIGWLVQAGHDIVQGLINGIMDMAGSVKSAAEHVASEAKNAITGLLGIHSPSTVMAQIGQFMMQGLAQGLTDSASLGASAAIQAATATMAGMDDYFEISSPSRRARRTGRHVMHGLAAGIRHNQSNPVKAAAEAAKAVSQALTANLKFATAANTFAASGDSIGTASGLVGPLNALTAQMTSAFAGFATGLGTKVLTAIKDAGSAAQAVETAFTDTLKFLTAMQTFLDTHDPIAIPDHLQTALGSVIFLLIDVFRYITGKFSTAVLTAVKAAGAAASAVIKPFEDVLKFLTELKTFTDSETPVGMPAHIQTALGTVIVQLIDVFRYIADRFGTDVLTAVKDAGTAASAVMKPFEDVLTFLTDLQAFTDAHTPTGMPAHIQTKLGTVMVQLLDVFRYIVNRFRGDILTEIKDAAAAVQAVIKAFEDVLVWLTALKAFTDAHTPVDMPAHIQTHLGTVMVQLVDVFRYIVNYFHADVLTAIKDAAGAVDAVFKPFESVLTFLKNLQTFCDANVPVDMPGDIAQQLGSVMTQLTQTFQTVAAGFRTGVLTSIKDAATAIDGVFKPFEDALKFLTDLSTFINGGNVQTLPANMLTGLTTLMTQLTTAFLQVAAGFKTTVLATVKDASDAIDAVFKPFEDALTFIKDTAALMKNYTSITIQGSFIPTLLDLMQQIVDGFQQFADGINTKALVSAEAVAAGVSKIVALMQTLITMFGNIAKMSAIGKSQWQTFVSNFTDALGIIPQLTDAAQPALAQAQAFMQVAGQIANDLNQGMATLKPFGISVTIDNVAASSNAAAAAQQTAQGVVNQVQQTLGVSSPSTVMDSIGQDTSAGLAQGLTKGAPGVSQAWSQVIGQIGGPSMSSGNTTATAGGGISGGPSGMNDQALRAAGITINFQAPVTINADDEDDAAHALLNVGMGVRAALLARGIRPV